jgi:hypothetical protein
MTGQSFVNGVINYLEHHMVQARTIIGITNVHTRALAHRVQTFENFNILGIVI